MEMTTSNDAPYLINLRHESMKSLDTRCKTWFGHSFCCCRDAELSRQMRLRS